MEIEHLNISTIAGLIVEIRKLNGAKGWRESGADGARTGPWFAAYCALATSEVSEALDAYRVKQWSATCEATRTETEYGRQHIAGCSGRPHDNPKPVGVGPEMADALIRLLDMIDIWDVDIEYELARVLDYGWTRPYQHGGKVL